MAEPSRTPSTQPAAASPAATRPSAAQSAAADLAAVLVFVLLGRTSHREGGTVAGFATTAWPFLTGCLAGWAVLSLTRRGRSLATPAGRPLLAGALVLASTVAVGMTLRRLFTHGGTPVSFVIVATSFLAAFLLGWRAAVRAAVSRRARG